MSVVCSASKHYSAGKTIAGFIAAGGRKHVSPATCLHILASIETLHARCETSSHHTSHLITHLNEFIKSNEIMANIIYTEPTDVFVVRIIMYTTSTVCYIIWQRRYTYL